MDSHYVEGEMLVFICQCVTTVEKILATIKKIQVWLEAVQSQSLKPRA